MFSNIGFQLYTIASLLQSEESLEYALKKLSDIGYTQVQTAGWETPKFAEISSNCGITVVGTHYDYEKIKNNVEETVELHKLLGTTNVGIGAMPLWAHENQGNLFKFIDEMNETAKLYEKHGMKLTYHNHSFEFTTLDGKKTIMEYMYDGFDKNNISFVLDTCWVAFAGADICEWIEKLTGRLDILHLKDTRSVMIDNWGTRQEISEVGRGLIAWDRVLKAAEKAGVKYYVVEQDCNWLDNDPLKALEASKKYLERYMK